MHYHKVTKDCTSEALQKYNADDSQETTVAIMELDEIAEYFYNLRTTKIEDEAECLRELYDTLEEIASRIDDRLYDFDRLFKEEREDE